MPIPIEYRSKYIYHFTHIDNLPYILTRGFLAPNELIRQGFSHHSIAERGIQRRRSQMGVTCGPGGVVHDYVPFYFCQRSSMLLAVINKKNVDQHEIIYFALPISVLDESAIVFTDAAANTDIPPNFYSDPSDLVRLDWNSINSLKYSLPTPEAKQARMAEVLIHGGCNVAAFAWINVWDEAMADRVRAIYVQAGLQAPQIQTDPHFYFTKWPDDADASLVTGPRAIRAEYLAAVEDIQQRTQNPSARFQNLETLRNELRRNFVCLPETAEIEGLQSDNAVHHEDVGAHTRRVVELLVASEWYNRMNPADQRLMEVAAYLHDIGKGPKSRWAQNNGRQKVDPDHPIGSVRMLRRILTEELATIKPRSVRVLTKLVCYHDVVGDIVGRGRDERQLVEIAGSERELDMLITLGMADMAALDFGGFEHILALRGRVLSALGEPAAEDDE